MSTLVRTSVAIALTALATASPGAVWYVNTNLTTGASDGTSWANAFRGPAALQDAISRTLPAGDEIWVVAGRYTPSATGPRTAVFTLRSGMAIYGGFNGTETQLSQRDWIANPTILSGDIVNNDSSGDRSDNLYHVLVGTLSDTTGILDGFTVSGGTANGSSASNQDRGAGILILGPGAPTIRNCRFIDNRSTFGGGAGYINAASPRFLNCTFQGNTGGTYGGAFDIAFNCNPIFERCAFLNNTAQRAGGVDFYGESIASFSNCLFVGNSATGTGQVNGGGALLVLTTSNATLRHCTIVGNSAARIGGGVVTSAATTSITNSIAWSNTGPVGAAQVIHSGTSTTTVRYSDIQGGFAGEGNISADPRLTPASTLSPDSPCIDTANNTLSGPGITLDRAGNPRFINIPTRPDNGVSGGLGGTAIADMGAFEVLCIADVDDGTGSGTRDGAVTLEDLLYYLVLFDGGAIGADVDDGSGIGRPDGGVGIEDLLFYLSRYDAGC